MLPILFPRTRTTRHEAASQLENLSQTAIKLHEVEENRPGGPIRDDGYLSFRSHAVVSSGDLDRCKENLFTNPTGDDRYLVPVTTAGPSLRHETLISGNEDVNNQADNEEPQYETLP